MSDEIIRRVMPYSKEAEEAVIASMLLNEEAIDIAHSYINSGDFYIKSCGVLFDAILDLHKNNIVAEPITLMNKIAQADVSEDIKDGTYLNEIIKVNVTSQNVEDYSKIVKGKSLLRMLIKTCQTIETDCYDSLLEEEDIIEEAEKRIFALTQSSKSKDTKDISQVVLDVLDDLERVSKNPGELTGISTGFIDLDRKLNGLQNSDLIILAARPSMGKTSLALNIASHIAIDIEKPILLFSLEMSSKQLVRRIFSLEGPIDSEKLRSGMLDRADWNKIIDTSNTIAASKIIMDDDPGINIAELRSKCRKYKANYPDLSLIIIDYLQLLKGSNSKQNENRQQEISEISRGLKQIARELDLPILALSQLSRAVEGRADKRPMMSDLRESGAIEQDADVIMFIYRDYVYNKETTNKNDAEIIIAKQRNGPTGTVNLTWLSEYTKFANKE